MLTKQVIHNLMRDLDKGSHRQIIVECQQLIKRYPSVAGLHEILGLAHAGRGDFRNAVKSLSKALKIMPGLRSAEFNLSRIHLSAGNTQLAIAGLHRFLKKEPKNAAAHHLLGFALYQQGEELASERHFTRALSLDSRLHESHFFLGQINHKFGKDDEALRHFQAVLDLSPSHFKAIFNIGNIHRDNRRPDEALVWFEKALEIRPDHTASLMNRGLTFVQLGQPERAIEDFKACLAIDPHHMDAYNNLSGALIEARQFEEALTVLDLALEKDPDFVDATFIRFIILALLQRFEEALPLAEVRFDPRIRYEPVLKYEEQLERWDGKSIPDKNLVVHAEQGIGDTIMFMRFLDQLPEEIANVTFAVQEPLAELIAAQHYDVDVITLSDRSSLRNETRLTTTVKCSVMSLPVILGLNSVRALAQPTRKIHVPDDHLGTWQSRLGVARIARVGFAFQGSRTHRNDKNRSIELDRFLECLPEGCDYHFLGVDIEPDDLQLLQTRGDIRTHHEDISDFCDTAALVSLMDRVVTVDTSVAHLAGALGVDTHILLAHTPDWRWGLEAERTFWYPSVTLHRQTARADWQAPLAAVAQELRLLADRA